MKILHISESFEGGVATAVSNYVSVTSDAGTEHFLLCNTRTNKLDGGILKQFSTVFHLPKSHFDAIKTVRRTIDKINPDVIHCHSSFGGAYGRVGGRHFPGLVVYSPHCYAFERQDAGRLTRLLYYVIEKILGRWTDVVVAVSRREKGLAEKIGGRSGFKAFFVPNFSALPAHSSGKRDKVVVGMGRLAPQKNPELFAEASRKVGGAKFIWIGDGDEKYKTILRGAGVELLGWKSQSEVSNILSTSSVYLHTALWEGFPMTILDAERSGLAIVALDAPYLDGMPKDYISDSSGLSGLVEEALDNKETHNKNRLAWCDALQANTPEVARDRLLRAYSRRRNKK